jgi:hypothetical protein
MSPGTVSLTLSYNRFNSFELSTITWLGTRLDDASYVPMTMVCMHMHLLSFLHMSLTQDEQRGPTMTITFVVFKALPDSEPIVVHRE